MLKKKYNNTKKCNLFAIRNLNRIRRKMLILIAILFVEVWCFNKIVTLIKNLREIKTKQYSRGNIFIPTLMQTECDITANKPDPTQQ